MEHSIPAIVRYRLPTPVDLESGQVVHTSRRLLVDRLPGKRFACVYPKDPDRVRLVPSKALLPLQHFLQRHPIEEFWMLIHKGRLQSGERDFMVYDPRSVRLGATPHRFESEGECLHYVNHYELSLNVFRVAHVAKQNRPVWFD